MKLRPARRTDLKGVLRLVRMLARFEKLKPPDAAAARRYPKDGFGRNPYFRILVAEQDRAIVAYAFYFFTYSTFRARPTLFLEDIFIAPEHRSGGLGEMMMRELARIAQRHNCARFEWMVLDWNVRAQKFYRRLGARHLKSWQFFRMDGAALQKLRGASAPRTRRRGRAKSQRTPRRRPSRG